MTRDEIMALDAAQLRLAIAEAKGFTRVKFDGMGADDDGMIWVVLVDKVKGYQSYTYQQVNFPNWPTDIAAAWELEEELTERKDRYKYTQYLIRIVGEDERDTLDVQQWQLIHATPIQRCRAWLMWKSEATK